MVDMGVQIMRYAMKKGPNIFLGHVLQCCIFHSEKKGARTHNPPSINAAPEGPLHISLL